MYSRLKDIRKALKMTQAEFSAELGISRSNLASIETGAVIPTEMLIRLICSKYGVDEIWLRTGEGDMFREVSRDEQVAAFFMGALSGDDKFKKVFISALAALDETAWEKLRDFAEKLYEDYKNEPGE